MFVIITGKTSTPDRDIPLRFDYPEERPDCEKKCRNCRTQYERYGHQWVNELHRLDMGKYETPVNDEFCIECVRDWMVDHPETMRDFLLEQGVLDMVVAEYFGLGNVLHSDEERCRKFVEEKIDTDTDGIRDAMRTVLEGYRDETLADFVLGL